MFACVCVNDRESEKNQNLKILKGGGRKTRFAFPEGNIRTVGKCQIALLQCKLNAKMLKPLSCLVSFTGALWISYKWLNMQDEGNTNHS